MPQTLSSRLDSHRACPGPAWAFGSPKETKRASHFSPILGEVVPDRAQSEVERAVRRGEAPLSSYGFFGIFGFSASARALRNSSTAGTCGVGRRQSFFM